MASGEDPALRTTMEMPRKLAAILSADVVGYSRLMGEDEKATIHTLTTYREVMTTLIQQNRGRVVDSPGDNLLADFPSVVDAVECAVAIQRELNARNTALPPDHRMQFRLGINLGDVITEGERIYGDGVNIAARLESLAEAGGICISGTVYDQVATKLALGYKFLGERTVKNITKPVRVYRVQTQSGTPGLKGRPWRRIGTGHWPRVAFAWVGLLLIVGGGMASWRHFVHPSLLMTVSPSREVVALPLPDKPSIAVLPFVNMSGESTQEYFSDGMTEDLITDLARLSGLFVIARNSVFTYKGKPVKPDQVSRELGVRYMLEGSVRKANDRVRITAQLIDATTGYHLWAERYDRDLQDIFAVQEEIARRITKALAVRLTPEEREHMEQQYTDNPQAWDYFMQGTALYRQYTKEANAQARELFEKAISLDPQFARAYASLAATHRQEWTFGWSQNLQASEQQAFELARESVRRDPLLPHGHHQLAYLYVYRDQHEEAVAAAEQAVKLAPNDADGHAALAQMLTYAGRPQDAIGLMEKAIRLNPKTPAYYFYHLGLAYYVMQQYDKARANLQEAINMSPNYRPARRYLAAVYIEQGLNKRKEGLAKEAEEFKEKALEEMGTLLKMGQPRSLGDRRRVAPFKDPAIRERVLAAWQEVGG
jgi:adenylate cyclase